MKESWLFLFISVLAFGLLCVGFYMVWRVTPAVQTISTWALFKRNMQFFLPRLFAWFLLALLLFGGLVFTQPEQAQVVIYKYALVISAAYVAYWLDRQMFPYARPDSYLKEFWQNGTKEPLNAADYEVVPEYALIFALVMLRRALITCAVIVGVTMGL